MEPMILPLPSTPGGRKAKHAVDLFDDVRIRLDQEDIVEPGSEHRDRIAAILASGLLAKGE
jgi:hypothetical protein